MKMRRLRLENFMAFEDLDVEWSPNVNVIFGENGTGKSSLMKVAYSALKTLSLSQKYPTKEKFASAFVDKICGVFKPEDDIIGRLATRKRGGSKTEIKLDLTESKENEFGKALGAFEAQFTSRRGNRAELKKPEKEPKDAFTPVFIPPKEMISVTANFQQLYETYYIPFDETYNDLTRLLDCPLKKGPFTGEQKEVLNALERVFKGKIYQENRMFYLRVKGQGDFEMSLVAEGLRKFATLWYIISTGSLSKRSILFWDELEANINPNLIKALVDATMVLAKQGVQVFVTTHSYFVQQYFNLYSNYRKSNPFGVDVKFFSLFFDETDDGQNFLKCEIGTDVSQMEHNAIMKEFISVLQTESEMIDNEL